MDLGAELHNQLRQTREPIHDDEVTRSGQGDVFKMTDNNLKKNLKMQVNTKKNITKISKQQS